MSTTRISLAVGALVMFVGLMDSTATVAMVVPFVFLAVAIFAGGVDANTTSA